MKVLVLGTGGKIHAILWKLSQSSAVSRIFCTFNNPAAKSLAEYIEIKETDTSAIIAEIIHFIKENEIALTVVESGFSFSANIADALRDENIPVFGSGESFSKIEKSASSAKKFFHKYKIPTPHFAAFEKEVQALEHARKAHYPLVIKFDKRSSGTDSIICESFSQAKDAIQFCLNNLYKPIVIEDYIIGKQVIYNVITDGYNALPLSNAYIYKKSQDGNGGALTEGMGAYSPVPFLDEKMEEKIAHRIFFPLIDGLNSEQMAFSGVLRANIIVDDRGHSYITSFKSSFGDTDAQTILPLLDEDLFAVMYSSAIGALSDDYEYLNFKDEHSVCVVLTSGGYPAKIRKGDIIEGLDEIDNDSTMVFQSSTSVNIFGETVSEGGRVLSVVSTASTMNTARNLAYEAVDLIRFNGMSYRKDIAKQRVFEPV